MKVLFLPELVGGDSVGLSKGLKEYGVETRVLSRSEHPFRYPADVVIARADDKSMWRRKFRLFSALRYLFDSWDVVHFNFGSTLLAPDYAEPVVNRPTDVARWLLRRMAEAGQWLELTVLKLRGIKIYVHFQGSDARQDSPWVHRGDEPDGEDGHRARREQSSRNWHKKRRIRRWDRFAHRIFFLNPDLAQYLPGRAEFVPYASVDPKEIKPSNPERRNPEIVVAHAPSNRMIKGTSLVELAVERIRAKGFPIRLDVIEGVSNAEVLHRLSLADVVVDQLHIGWYGAFAVEAMALGKPVLCYINMDDLTVIDPSMKADLPILVTSPKSIEDTLLKVMGMDSKELEYLGKSSREFVLKWHDPAKIAAKLYFPQNKG